MKGRYPLNHRTERRIIGEMFINLCLMMQDAISIEPHTPVDGAMLMVCAAIIVGHAEDKPLNASKIADFTDQPRTTVLRKLDTLIDQKIIVKQGHHYLLAQERAFNQSARINSLLKMHMAATAEMREVLSKPDTNRLPFETDAH